MGAEVMVQSLGLEDPLEKEMATHSSIFAWIIPWIEEPRGHKELDTTEQSDYHFNFFFHSSAVFPSKSRRNFWNVVFQFHV